jgi:hypothetical protein
MKRELFLGLALLFSPISSNAHDYESGYQDISENSQLNNNELTSLELIACGKEYKLDLCGPDGHGKSYYLSYHPKLGFALEITRNRDGNRETMRYFDSKKRGIVNNIEFEWEILMDGQRGSIGVENRPDIDPQVQNHYNMLLRMFNDLYGNSQDCFNC